MAYDIVDPTTGKVVETATSFAAALRMQEFLQNSRLLPYCVRPTPKPTPKPAATRRRKRFAIFHLKERS